MFPSIEATRSSIRRAAIIPRDTMRIRRRWRLGCLSVYRWNITSGQGGVRPDYSQDSFLPDGGEVQVQFHQRRGNSTWHFLGMEAYQREEKDGARWGSVTFARMHAMVVAVVRGERKQASCRRLLAESQRLHLCPCGRNTRTSDPIPLESRHLRREASSRPCSPHVLLARQHDPLICLVRLWREKRHRCLDVMSALVLVDACQCQSARGAILELFSLTLELCLYPLKLSYH